MAGDSSYTKVVTTIGKADLLIQKVEFHDASGLIKTLEVKKTERDASGLLVPVETEMVNVQKGTRTVMAITAHQLNVGAELLPDEVFTKAYLERGGS